MFDTSTWYTIYQVQFSQPIVPTRTEFVRVRRATGNERNLESCRCAMMRVAGRTGPYFLFLVFYILSFFTRYTTQIKRGRGAARGKTRHSSRAPHPQAMACGAPRKKEKKKSLLVNKKIIINFGNSDVNTYTYIIRAGGAMAAHQIL